MKPTLVLHHRRILFAILCVAACVGFAGPAYAQQPTSTSVEGALQAHFADDSKAADAAVFGEAGYTYKRLLVAEILPSESTLFAEVELVRDDTRLRYPLKLARRLEENKLHAKRIVWQVSWAPVEAYARRLVEVAGEGGLASFGPAKEGETATRWADIERLPAFPVIVGGETLVTPFGPIVNASDSDPKTIEQAVLKALGEYAQRWVGLTLEDEPGTANVDLLLGHRVTWRRAMQALMPPASQGLFRTYLVARERGQVVALPTAAPVVRQTPDGASPLVVGMYRHADGHGFRIRLGDALVEADPSKGDSAGNGACADTMTFCTGPASSASLDTFEQSVLDRVTAAIKEHDTQIAYVMFAATGEFDAGEVVRHLDALGTALGVPSSKVFIGYIGAQ